MFKQAGSSSPAEILGKVVLGPRVRSGMLTFLRREQLQSTAGHCRCSQGCLQQSWWVPGTGPPPHRFGGVSTGQSPPVRSCKTHAGLNDAFWAWPSLRGWQEGGPGEVDVAPPPPSPPWQVDRAGQDPLDGRSWEHRTAPLAVSRVAGHGRSHHREPRHPAGFGPGSGTLILAGGEGCCHHQPWPNSASRQGAALHCPGFGYPPAASPSKPRLTPKQQAADWSSCTFGAVFPDHPPAGHKSTTSMSRCSLGLTCFKPQMVPPVTSESAKLNGAKLDMVFPAKH